MSLVQGIYGVLPQNVHLAKLLEMAQAALEGGVRVLQLRDKQLAPDVVDARLTALYHMMTAYQATLILNDRVPDVPTGVHVGRDDFEDIFHLRQQCGTRLLGVTCKGDLDFAAQALAAGANYISLGAMYPTSSKKDAQTISIKVLHQARDRFPAANIVVIGGIQRTDFPELRAAGADAVAMIQGLFGARKIEQQARSLVQCWESAA